MRYERFPPEWAFVFSRVWTVRVENSVGAEVRVGCEEVRLQTGFGETLIQPPRLTFRAGHVATVNFPFKTTRKVFSFLVLDPPMPSPPPPQLSQPTQVGSKTQTGPCSAPMQKRGLCNSETLCLSAAEWTPSQTPP